MIYAKSAAGNTIEADRNEKEKGFCPSCEEELIKKCGSIKIWHWAHKSGNDCDVWSEPETEWHLEMKQWFIEQGWLSEQIIGCHRTDVKHPTQNLIIEVQHSPISPEKIEERTAYYHKNGYAVIWIFNATEWKLDLRERISKTGREYISFRWKYPHRSLRPLFDEDNGRATRTLVLFDINDDTLILKIDGCHIEGEYVGGWGNWIDMEDFFPEIPKKTPQETKGLKDFA